MADKKNDKEQEVQKEFAKYFDLKILSPVMRRAKKKERGKDITDYKKRRGFFHFLHSVSLTLYCSVCFPSHCSELFLDEIY